jgi:DNA-binding CsgD family transcriptional regulator
MHRAQKASTHAAFDRLPFGVVLLNESRKVIHLNKSAEHVMARRDGLAVNDRGMLEGQGAKRDEGTLQGWLARFADQAETDPGHFSDGFAVARYMLQCAPVASEGSWDVQAGEVRFVVFITDPAALTLPDASRLVELYGLTPTQARIALEFARGHSYKQVARRLRISEETVRSHVKVIYPRTGVNRQADLVRLVLSLAQVRI